MDLKTINDRIREVTVMLINEGADPLEVASSLLTAGVSVFRVEVSPDGVRTIFEHVLKNSRPPS